MIYILDAYNVIHKTPSLEKLLEINLKSARDALARGLSEWARMRGDVIRCVLVFDGKSEHHGVIPDTYPKIEFIFSDSDETADERIACVLDQLTLQKAKCVVSDDNYVCNQARAYQTRRLSVASFNALWMNRKGTTPSFSESPARGALSKREAEQITAAYKRHLGLP